MKKYKLVSILFLVILSMLWGRPMQAQDASSSINALQPGSIFIADLAADLGNTHNCFFTIEEAREDNVREVGLALKQVPKYENYPDLKGELDHLSQILPNFSFKINRNNPKIIHIIDTRLLQRDHYAMNDVISKIGFKGQFYDLLAVITAEGISISGPEVISIQDMRTMDMTTTVRVAGENLQVRDVLTNCIPLKGRGRILWTARTKLGSGETTHIKF